MGKTRGSSASSKSDSSKEYEAYFSGIYGEKRWKALRLSMLRPCQLVALQNGFTQDVLASDASFTPWLSSGGCRTYRHVACGTRMLGRAH